MSLARAVSDMSIGPSGVAHVEVRLKPSSLLRFDTIRQSVQVYVQEHFTRLEVGAELEGWQDVGLLGRECDRVSVTDCSLDETFPLLDTLDLQIHVYQTSAQTVLEEFAANLEDDDDDEQVMAASVRELPSRELDGLWDNLIYPDDIKGRLLNYIYSTLLFSDANVDFDVITWNRVVLLHGPPGTGKTSLCRALAQKLSVRLSHRYTHGKIVEINSHSLFSKWFSESGKLVQKLFSTVTEMVEDESGFVVVLMDEVESLTAARAGAMAGSEPSDALRVVNALLTQLDKLKHRKNVLIMATSNIAQAIDSAFVDRADIKQYIGLPPPEAIYWILKGCLNELMRAELVDRVELAEWKDATTAESAALAALARQCNGMSGRTLRRLPVLAHARYIAQSRNSRSPSHWIQAIARVVSAENEQLEKIEQLVAAGSV